ncbi:MAG: spiro-SPASM protein [Treponema sp.]|nr:spiro-SPASM protein [Treponema sp.]
MRALTVLYGASLASQAFEPVFKDESAFNLALKRASAFPGSEKTVLLAGEGETLKFSTSVLAEQGISVIQKPDWTVSELLKTLSEASAGFDFAYYAWADSPFLDAALAGKVAGRHTRYAAEYSYADGWPGGMGPELVTSASAGILYKIAGDAGRGPVKRDSLFTVLQKDINAFDIETEISLADLRHHRLNFNADSKRNLLLLERFAGAAGDAGFADNVAQIIADHPGYLRTLPAFFPIQAAGPCPKNDLGSCGLCPYPLFGGTVTERKDFLSPGDFFILLDKIEQFAGDAVIDLSLWGEIALHPEKEDLILAVLERPALSLIIETSGCGWGNFDLEKTASIAAAAKPRKNGLPALSWIVSLNPAELPLGENTAGGTEGTAFVKKLVSLFPREEGRDSRVYVEAIRTTGEEDAIEKFYRSWKTFGNRDPGNHDSGPSIIIQKHDSFCGFLPPKQAVDLSPVERRPCWHLMRDFPVFIDGSVFLCREELGKPPALGNAFQEDLESIWNRGEGTYLSHCKKEYADPCKVCDEYYTYNF